MKKILFVIVFIIFSSNAFCIDGGATIDVTHCELDKTFPQCTFKKMCSTIRKIPQGDRFYLKIKNGVKNIYYLFEKTPEEISSECINETT